MNEPLLEIKDLVVNYGNVQNKHQVANAVDGVNLTLQAGETLGLVGESGSGKSSIARSVVGLTKWSGQIAFDGSDMNQLRGGALRRVRQNLQMIFQDPYGTLDPRMPIGKQIAEPLLAHGFVQRDQLKVRVSELLEMVELDGSAAANYPHQFSGGQRQRVAIARAIGLSPKLIVCDEPTSALDVSVQAQILKLLDGLQRDHGIAYLFIAHNLGVVRQVSDRVAVMYMGKLVETGSVEEVFDNPQHWYTKALLNAVLEPEPSSRHRGRRRLTKMKDSSENSGDAR